MIVAIAVSGVLAAALLGPHLLAQSSLAPKTGVALWSSVLVLRAALMCVLAVIAFFYLPATELFGLLTHWCFHAVVPFFTDHLGFDGHGIGDAAVVVPAAVIATLATFAGFGLYRSARHARALVGRAAVGRGPRESVIVGGPEIVVAAAGLRAPQVVVSAGALMRLDDDELAAGLEHEWGHVTHRHGLVLAAAQLCAAVSRVMPGGSSALAALRFQLERQADDYAVGRTGDALALAAAISKSAGAPSGGAAIAMLGGERGGAERIRLLLGSGARRSVRASRVARALAISACALAVALTASLPLLVAAAPAHGAAGHAGHVCEK